jgi:glycosyltransferase involved in cell wall biosynthesis
MVITTSVDFNGFATYEQAFQIMMNEVQYSTYAGYKYIQPPLAEDLDNYEPLSISLLVSNWNQANHSKAFFKAIADNQFDLDKFEIIYVDHNSQDQQTWFYVQEALNQYPQLKNISFFWETYIDKTGGLAYPINIALRKAKNDVVIICPSDTLIKTDCYFDYVGKIHNYFKDHEQTKAFVSPLCYDARDYYKANLFWLNPCRDMGGSLLRKTFVKLTGFDERIRGWGGSEVELFRRLQLLDINICPFPYLIYEKLLLLGVFYQFCAEPNKIPLPADPYNINGDNWGLCETLEQIIME